MAKQTPVDELVAAAVTPTTSEVVESRWALLARLADGEEHDSVALIRGAAEDAGARRIEPKDAAQLPHDRDLPTVDVARDDPVIRGHRLMYAAAWALAEMDAAGLVVPHSRRGGGGQTVEGVLRGRMPLHQPGRKGSVETPLRLPALALRYRLSSVLVQSQDPSLLDPTVYVRALVGSEVDVDRRTLRCFEEGLQAWRRGMMLATVNLLGAGIEGCWVAAARHVGDEATKTAEELDRGTGTSVAQVQKHLGAWLASTRRWRSWDRDAQASHVRFVRTLRNYGVHGGDDDLDDYLTEDQVAALYLTAHRMVLELFEAAAGQKG